MPSRYDNPRTFVLDSITRSAQHWEHIRDRKVSHVSVSVETSGKQGSKQSTSATTTRLVRQLLSEGNTAGEGPKQRADRGQRCTATLKKYGADTPPESGEIVHGWGRSQYAARTSCRPGSKGR